MDIEFEGLGELIEALNNGLKENSTGAKRNPSNELGQKYQAALFATLDLVMELASGEYDDEDEDNDEDEEDDEEEEAEAPEPVDAPTPKPRKKSA